MSEQEQAAIAAHYAPLRWLVANKLHKGATLAELVRQHRWKRKRSAAAKGEQ